MGVSRQYFYQLVNSGAIPYPVFRMGERDTVLYDRESIITAKEVISMAKKAVKKAKAKKVVKLPKKKKK